jgi:hypothetical protein
MERKVPEQHNGLLRVVAGPWHIVPVTAGKLGDCSRKKKVGTAFVVALSGAAGACSRARPTLTALQLNANRVRRQTAGDIWMNDQHALRYACLPHQTQTGTSIPDITHLVMSVSALVVEHPIVASTPTR